MAEKIVSGILFLIALMAFFMSYRSFKEKGFLFNNAYIYASKQERERMEKRPHYRQSAVVFLLIAVIFLLNGISLLLKASWMIYPVIAVVVIAIVYAIVSSIVISRRQ